MSILYRVREATTVSDKKLRDKMLPLREISCSLKFLVTVTIKLTNKSCNED
jgi:hypothetical protein